MEPALVTRVSVTNSPYDSWVLRVVWTVDVVGYLMDCLNCSVASSTCPPQVADNREI